MATIDFETAIATRQLLGPTIEQMEEHGRDWLKWTRDPMFPQPDGDTGGFGDRRVFFVHDASHCCGNERMRYEQSCSGPTFVFIASDDVPDCVLAKFAERHDLVLDELIHFRDQFDKDIILATPGIQ